MILLGRPGNGQLNTAQFIVALICSFILSFSSNMFFFIIHHQHKISVHLPKNINNSFEFLKLTLEQMSFMNYAAIFIGTIIYLILVLRMTVWAGEDDRIIL